MTTHEPVREIDVGVPLRLLAGLAAALVVLFSITTVPGFRSGNTFHTGYDGWLQGTAYVVPRSWRWCVRRSAVATGCSGDCSDWRSA